MERVWARRALRSARQNPRSDAAERNPRRRTTATVGRAVRSAEEGARSAAADDAAAYQSECRPGGPYGAPRKAPRSAAADVFAAAYQSECRPGGPYGALEIAPGRPLRPGGSWRYRESAHVLQAAQTQSPGTSCGWFATAGACSSQ